MKSIHFLKTSPKLLTLFVLLLFLAALTVADLSRTFAIFRHEQNLSVVLDAGHGGEDPGKVSASGVKEKDINLAIALKCKRVLEQNGITVHMTREEDRSLEDASAGNKKASDLYNRKKIITESGVRCAVSIHQNSFPDSSQHGAQIFYQTGKEDSKRLASLIQEQTRTLTGEENHREIKSNSDYYLLRDNAVPTVIAEVCFLSNPCEAALITEENIQEKAAFAIAMGIMQYLYS